MNTPRTNAFLDSLSHVPFDGKDFNRLADFARSLEEETNRLAAVLAEASAGLEFAGADQPPPTGFVPSPTRALLAVRSALEGYVAGALVADALYPRKTSGWRRTWRGFMCSRGRHVMRVIPTGRERLPWYVAECVHCGVVRDGVSTPHGTATIGEWASFGDFINSEPE